MIEKLTEKYPQYAMRIERMAREGYEYEEILAWVRNALEMDEGPDIAPPWY
jgi:GMP synthase-like glutamine amidotransferase